jgi:hypothetical protein
MAPIPLLTAVLLAAPPASPASGRVAIEHYQAGRAALQAED